jgi:SulP family sulfate permease
VDATPESRPSVARATLDLVVDREVHVDGRRWSGPSGRDLVAGVSVALVLAPQSLAYAQLAGLPPVHGLYAAIAAPVAAALLASSPYLQTGPVAMTSLLTLGALADTAPLGSAEFAVHAALLALVVGLARVLLGLARAGVIGYLLSAPATAGFTGGAAILIISSQVPTLLGVSAEADNPLVGAARALSQPTQWDLYTVILGVAVILVIFGARRLHPLLPGVLIATAAALVLVRFVGPIGKPVGRLDLSLPPAPTELPWASFPSLIVPGIVIAIVGFAEPASIARRYASLERQRWSPDRELVSQGVANLASGLAAGFPVGGSFSRTAVNKLAGARSRWSGAVTGLAVLALLPFAEVLATLPRTALAGLVIAAVISLIDVKALYRFWQLSPVQGVVAVGTLVATLALAPHLERAVLLGVGMALAVHLWRELHLPVTVSFDGATLRLRPTGVLYFASAPGLEDTLLDLLADHPEVERIEIDLSSLGRIDLTGMLALRAVVDDVAARCEVEVVEVPPPARRLVRRVLPDHAEAEPVT